MSTCSPGASRVAAISISAEFFAPEIDDFAGERPVRPHQDSIHAVSMLDPRRHPAAKRDQEHRSRWPASSTATPTRRLSLLEPRDDIVHEVRRARRFVHRATGGPFVSYRRTSSTTEDGAVVEIDRVLARGPVLRVSLRASRRGARCSSPARDGVPWWAPPERLDARAATALGVLAAVALIVGYLNTLLTQTIAFAADEFGSSDRAQGVSLAIVRCGVRARARHRRDRRSPRTTTAHPRARRRRPDRRRDRRSGAVARRGSRRRRRSHGRSRWRSASSSPSSRSRRCPPARARTR